MLLLDWTDCVEVAGRADWPVAGCGVVNDVRGRRSQVAEFTNTQLITADDVSL